MGSTALTETNSYTLSYILKSRKIFECCYHPQKYNLIRYHLLGRAYLLSIVFVATIETVTLIFAMTIEKIASIFPVDNNNEIQNDLSILNYGIKYANVSTIASACFIGLLEPTVATLHLSAQIDFSETEN